MQCWYKHASHRPTHIPVCVSQSRVRESLHCFSSMKASSHPSFCSSTYVNTDGHCPPFFPCFDIMSIWDCEGAKSFGEVRGEPISACQVLWSKRERSRALKGCFMRAWRRWGCLEISTEERRAAQALVFWSNGRWMTSRMAGVFSLSVVSFFARKACKGPNCPFNWGDGKLKILLFMHCGTPCLYLPVSSHPSWPVYKTLSLKVENTPCWK